MSIERIYKERRMAEYEENILWRPLQQKQEGGGGQDSCNTQERMKCGA